METKFDKFLKIYSMITIFIVFMGQTFLKFTIAGVEFNVGRVVIFGLIPLLLIKFVKSKQDFKISDKKIKYIIVFYIVWAVYSVISGLWCEDKKMYIISNFYVVTGAVEILFFAFCVNVKENLNKYFYIMQIGALISCIYYFFIKDTYIAGFYHNTNDLATALVFIFPITIYLLYNAKNIFLIIYEFIAFMIYYYAFYLIGSRACSLGIELGAILFVALISIKNRNNILKNNKLKIISISLLILLSIMLINDMTNKVGSVSTSSIEQFENTEGQAVAKSSNQKRINLIYNAIIILKNDCNWLHGIGSGNTIYYMENYGQYNTGGVYNLHNYWLDIFLCYGIILLVGYIVAYFLICKILLEKIKITDKHYNILENKNFIFLFFLLSFILASISSSTIITREWMWLAFAIIIGYIKIIKERKN